MGIVAVEMHCFIESGGVKRLKVNAIFEENGRGRLPEKYEYSKIDRWGCGLLSGCSTWAFLAVACGLCCPTAYGILVLLPGIKPDSPALKGRFFTTG